THTQTGRARPDPPNLVARNPDQTHRSTQLQCNCLAASMNPPILLKMTVHLNRSGLGFAAAMRRTSQLLPLLISVKNFSNWQSCLREAFAKLNETDVRAMTD